MQKSLVIVESPAKAKTIHQYLGDKYIVKSSIGHVRDLITKKSKIKNYTKNISSKLSEKKKLIQKMGINPYKNWKAEYHILPGKEKIVTDLKKIANKVNRIYLATDLDREGEAIAWHLKKVIGGDSKKFSRVVFNEITQRSIEKAFKNISHINMNKVHAQQARRFMDRIVGYMISPLLWKKVSKGVSAGRVQSVAVRIVVEREYIIKIFTPEEYWKISVSFFFNKKKSIEMDIISYDNKIFRPINKKQVDSAIEKIKKLSCIITHSEDKICYKKPPAPFITSTLQQASNTYLGFSVKKTMFLAQKLYEEGYITYMRTDSTYLSKKAIKKARAYIKNKYGEKYIPKEPNVYSNNKFSQDAHEAIRPSNIETEKIQIRFTDTNAKKLYQLIWNQFIASQMQSAMYKSISITVKANKFQLKKNKRIVIFKGWTKVLKNNSNSDLNCSDFKVGRILTIKNIISCQKFTKPLPRFTEASLVCELEKRGIGRPSTYASIISKIQERGYLTLKKNKFYAEKIGEILIMRLKKNFSDLIDYNFTARMERELDKIAENKISWKNLLDSFFYDFNQQIEEAKKTPEEGGMELNKIIETSFNCPECNKKMGIKTAITGIFLSCSGYNNNLINRCKKTINLVSINNSKNNHDKILNNSKNLCKNCNTKMDSYLINDNLKLHICINSPNCTEYKIEKGKFKNSVDIPKDIVCDKCKNYMILNEGRFGKFFLCINNQCKNKRKILPNGEISNPKLDPIPFPELLCKESNAWFVLKEGVSGIFLAAHTFPKSRETRSPLVEELAKFKHLLPKKIHYLSNAPKLDDQGNKTIVCFNRKTKQQYIASKKNGKFTNWLAVFIDKKWCILKKK